MRLIGYTLLSFIFLLMLGAVVNKFLDVDLLVKQSTVSSDSYSRARVFYFPENNKLNFNIPANTQQIRILLNAELSSFNSTSQIAVEYRLTGKSDSQFNDNVLFKSTKTENLDLLNSQRFFSKEYGAIASATNERLLDIPLGTDKLSLSISPYDLKVAVRVYALEEIASKKAELEWRRSHPDEKKALVVPHIYPPELIASNERLNATSIQWSSVGPEGVRGVDYYSDFILSKNEVKALSTETSHQSEIYLSQQAFYTHRDFDTLEVAQFGCRSLDNQETTVRLQYIDSETERLVNSSFRLQRNSLASLPASMGFVQFSATNDCYMRFYNEIGKSLKIEPLKRFTHQLSAAQPLEFQLNPNSTALQALKIDARVLLSNAESADSPIDLKWTVLSSAGEVIAQATKRLIADNNPYEYILENNKFLPVSVKNQWYILADKRAAVFKLSISAGVVLSKVYARPLNLPVRLQQTEGENKSHGNLSPLLTWFSLKPISPNDDIQKLQSYWNPAFKMPTSEIDPWMREWRSLINSSSFVSNELFYLVDNAGATASDHSFMKLTGLSDVFFQSIYDRPLVSPEVVYIRQERKPQQISLFLEGELLMQTWLVNQSGSFKLPNIQTGQYKLEIKGGGEADFYINNLANKSGTNAKKLSTVLLTNPLELSFTKETEQEWLTIRYFPATDKDHQISVELLTDYKQGSEQELTLPKRQFNYRVSHHAIHNNLSNKQRSGVYILNQKAKLAKPPVTILFPLKADLKQKDYQIRIKSSMPRSGYLQAGYLIDQVSGKAIVFTEDNSDEVY
jgi:hypothetical protein